MLIIFIMLYLHHKYIHILVSLCVIDHMFGGVISALVLAAFVFLLLKQVMPLMEMVASQLTSPSLAH